MATSTDHERKGTMKRFILLRDGEQTTISKSTKAAVIEWAQSFQQSHPEHTWEVYDRRCDQVVWSPSGD